MKNHDAEDADAAEFAARGAMLMVSPGGIEPQPVNQPAGGEGAWGNNM